MANIHMDRITIGKEYTLPELAEEWEYVSYHGLRKGIVTQKNSKIIVLFVTEQKQANATQYYDELRGEILFMQGQNAHGTDKRLSRNLRKEQDEIYLFYRERHHTPFVFYGQVRLVNFQINEDKPSEFEFWINNFVNSEDNQLLVDIIACEIDEGFKSAPSRTESLLKIAKHVRYERDSYNRLETIRIQGRKCKICGFDFNDYYGSDIADGYIEIHCTKPISDSEHDIDIENDFIPICANCHRMLHLKK